MSNVLYINNAAELITVKGYSNIPAKKAAMSEIGIIKNGSVLSKGGKIIAVGTDEEIRKEHQDLIDQAEIVDATGRIVTPGLVDPHTHIVYAGTRENEYAMRLEGKAYMDIMNAGGGIHATTRATQQATSAELYEQSKNRLDKMLLNGITTIEAKSGYGLTTEHELKQLEVAEKLNKDHQVDLISTFMGAHAVPMDYKDNPEVFVDIVINEMLPVVAEKNLAVFNDVFCERDVFTPEQSRRILEAGKKHGLKPKIHADEIEPYGGSETAAEVNAISADHLLRASDKGIQMMAENDVIGVLLPGTAFFLMADYAEARKMIDSGMAVALSTDANPGSSPTLSLQFIMNLGCLEMGMNPKEVITATTINAAHAIDAADRIGSIEVGKDADFTMFDVKNHLMLSYQYGMNHAHTVVKKGKVVVADGHIIK